MQEHGIHSSVSGHILPMGIHGNGIMTAKWLLANSQRGAFSIKIKVNKSVQICGDCSKSDALSGVCGVI